MPNRRIIIYPARRLLELYEGTQRIGYYPIAVGKKSTPTPLGCYNIVMKTVYPGGAFGSRWMGLSIRYYGIHGTNNPSSIGKAVSKGCIRMHNHDVNNLFELVEIGTPVTIQS